MALNAESSAALVFLILYTILFVILIYGYATKRFAFRSRYTIIFVHVTFRLGAQATGLAFGIVGYSNIGLLVAYFVLNAEGYFTLVLCAYRFLIDWHYHNFEAHDSWLEPRFPPDYPRHRRIIESFSLFGSKRNPMAIMHFWLILANALIVSGGSSLAGGMEDYTQFLQKLHKSKIMRTIGQSVFLTFNTLLLFLIIYTIRQYRREQQGKPTTTIHPTLLILLITWPFLFVRGLYGILSGIYGPFNYFYLSNYDANGLKNSFVISEYILATTMEWTSCSLLMFSYITSLNDPPIPPLPSWKDQEKELASS